MAGEVVAKQNRYIRRLRDADAFSADRAVSLGDIRMRPSFVFKGLLNRGVVLDAGDGRYFLDRERLDAFLERRRQIILWAAVIAVILVVIGLLVAYPNGLHAWDARRSYFIGVTSGPLTDGIAMIERAPFLSAERKRDILDDNAARFLRLDGAK